MTNEIKKGDDGELSSLLVVNGIFSLVLLIVDFTYGNMHALLSSWVKWPFVILHAASFILWIIVIAYRDEPNLEFLRKILVGTLIASLLLVLIHRSGFISDKMFQEDVDKNKKEQDTVIKQMPLKLDTIIKK